MIASRQLIVGVALLATLAAAGVADARSVGQVIDDTAITTQIKARLAADQLSNLTKIEVTTHTGIVTLGGVVEEPERKARAAQVASMIDGVKGIVNNIHVAGSTISAAPLPAPPVSTPPTVTTPVPGPITSGTAVDATGVVSSVDSATGTITLQDGRVLRATGDTVVWQASPIKDLRPGTQVLVRGATPIGVQPTVTSAPPEWRMGTVSRVDHAASQLVLTDGTVVRVSPTTVLHRRGTRVWLDQVAPGAEVVVRTPPPRSASAEGSALPGSVPASALIDASEINVVWTPVGGSR